MDTNQLNEITNELTNLRNNLNTISNELTNLRNNFNSVIDKLNNSDTDKSMKNNLDKIVNIINNGKYSKLLAYKQFDLTLSNGILFKVLYHKFDETNKHILEYVMNNIIDFKSPNNDGYNPICYLLNNSNISSDDKIEILKKFK